MSHVLTTSQVNTFFILHMNACTIVPVYLYAHRYRVFTIFCFIVLINACNLNSKLFMGYNEVLFPRNIPEFTLMIN